MPRGWFKIRKIKDVQTVDGKRYWLIAWDGVDESGKAWPDSWEPTACVTEEAIEEYTTAQAAVWQHRLDIDIGPAQMLVQRKIAAVVMGDAEVQEQSAAFGHVHDQEIKELAWSDISSYVIDRMRERYPAARYDECFNVQTQKDVQELRLEVEDAGDFCDFGNPEIVKESASGINSLRMKKGRKSNQDVAVVAVIKIKRFFSKKQPRGFSTTVVEFHTCHVNGATGRLTPPHLVKGLLKQEPYLERVRSYVRKVLPDSHILAKKGFKQLEPHIQALPLNVAVPTSPPKKTKKK